MYRNRKNHAEVIGSLCSPPGELACQRKVSSPRSLPSWCLQASLHWHKGKFKLTVGFPPGWAEGSLWRCVQHGLQLIAPAEGVRLHTCPGMMIKIMKWLLHCTGLLLITLVCFEPAGQLSASWLTTGLHQQRLTLAWGESSSGWRLWACLSEQRGHP